MLNDLRFIGQFIIDNLVGLWPYLALSIPLAVAIRLSNASRFIRRALSGNPRTAILLAVLVGAFSPFCSCTVVPIVASMLIAGVPLSPVMAFWIASPAMDPEIFLLSAAILGWELAIARMVATLLLSLSAGYLTYLLEARGFFGGGILRERQASSAWSWANLRESLSRRLRQMLPQKQAAPAPVISLAAANLVSLESIGFSPAGGGAGAADDAGQVESSDGGSCGGGDSCETGTSAGKDEDSSFRAKLWQETWGAGRMIVGFMLFAFLLEALILLYVPQAAIVELVGTGNPLAILLASLIGIPVYTSNLAALPLTGALLQQGMLPGAALAFLIAGPTTTLPAMAAVYGIARPRVFLIYFLCALLGAILLGYGYQLLQVIL
jgi:hypothetical protein